MFAMHSSPTLLTTTRFALASCISQDTKGPYFFPHATLRGKVQNWNSASSFWASFLTKPPKTSRSLDPWNVASYTNENEFCSNSTSVLFCRYLLSTKLTTEDLIFLNMEQESRRQKQNSTPKLHHSIADKSHFHAPEHPHFENDSKHRHRCETIMGSPETDKGWLAHESWSRTSKTCHDAGETKENSCLCWIDKKKEFAFNYVPTTTYTVAWTVTFLGFQDETPVPLRRIVRCRTRSLSEHTRGIKKIVRLSSCSFLQCAPATSTDRNSVL